MWQGPLQGDTGTGNPGEAADPGTLLAGPEPGEHSLSWWGHLGNTYFILSSTDLDTWSYLPVIEAGADAPALWSFPSAKPRQFVRLRYSDTPSSDPERDDFDADGVSNIDELNQGSDPLHVADGDADSLPDDWEQFHHLDPRSPDDAGSDRDDDTLSAAQEFAFGSNPTRWDSDRDALSDTFEAHAGTLVPTPARAPYEARPSTGLIVYSPPPTAFDPAP